MAEVRKLAAILAADIVGYSRLTQADEDRTLARVRALRSDLIDPTIAVHHGRIVKRTGDGAIVEFRSVVEAVACAREVQNAMIDRNAGVAEEQRILFRIGIHVGDVVEESDGDLMGDGINIAARLEGIAKAGAICLSEDAYRQVRSRIDLRVNDLGPTQLKNIAEPVRVYSVEIGASNKAQTAPDRVKQMRLPGSVRTALGAISVLLLVALGLVFWFASGNLPNVQALWGDRGVPKVPRISLLVMPFANVSGDPRQDYLAEGISDDLTADLGHLDESFVIDRSTALTFKGRNFDIKQVGRDLGVRYVVQGSVARAGDNVEVSARVTSTETGAQIWSDRWKAEINKLASLQATVAGRIAYAMDVGLSKIEGLRSLHDGHENSDAGDLALRATSLLITDNLTSGALDQAIGLFERALQIEPGQYRATRNLAAALGYRVMNRWSRDLAVDLARAQDLATKALAEQPHDSWAHVTQAFLHALKKQYRLALSETRKAVEDNPSNANAYGAAAQYEMNLGLSAEGVADAEMALRLNPRGWQSADYENHLCYLRSHLGQWEKAIDQCEKVVARLDMNAAWAWAPLGALAASYDFAGQTKAAKDTLELASKNHIDVIQRFKDYLNGVEEPAYRPLLERVIARLRKITTGAEAANAD